MTTRKETEILRKEIIDILKQFENASLNFFQLFVTNAEPGAPLVKEFQDDIIYDDIATTSNNEILEGIVGGLTYEDPFEENDYDIWVQIYEYPTTNCYYDDRPLQESEYKRIHELLMKILQWKKEGKLQIGKEDDNTCSIAIPI
jgi:hypothetical protein